MFRRERINQVIVEVPSYIQWDGEIADIPELEGYGMILIRGKSSSLALTQWYKTAGKKLEERQDLRMPKSLGDD